jgi:hypothetical protein
MKNLEPNDFTNPSELARRAAMLKEAANALPTGRERDRLLVQLRVLEGQLQRSTFQRLDAAE